MELGTGAYRKGVLGQDWSGRASRVRLVIHVRPPTSEGHNFFVRTPIRVLLDSMEIPLSQYYIHTLRRALGTGVGQKGVLGQDWSGRASRVRLVIHVRPPTSEGHNFFIRTSIRVFLDSMEIPLSQESINI